jgi:PIN domain nuclease of toxin-antitoxin system
MKLLLDTHTFLWFIEDSPQLGTEAKNLLESDVDLLIRVASLWEIAIKISIGKLTLTQPFDTFIQDQLTKNAIDLLAMDVQHLALVSTLPLHHRDPFDRLLVAQAIIEQIPIVSIDDKFDLYGATRMWGV